MRFEGWSDNPVYGFQVGAVNTNEDGVYTGELNVGVRALENLKKHVRAALESGEGITFCAPKGVEGVKDLAKVTDKAGESIGRRIEELWGYELPYKQAIFRYLLRVSACYVEVPQKRNRDGMLMDSFDKYIATSSPEVVAEWMGITFEEARQFLKGRLDWTDVVSEDEEERSLTPYVKLYRGKEGEPKVTKPRKDLDLSTKGMKVMPLCLLREYRDGLIEKLKKSIVCVKYTKDNGEIREMFTTLNCGKLAEIYGEDSEFYKRLTHFGELVDGEGNYRVGIQEERGYIRVPEVGASQYDESGVRAINYFRVVEFEENAEPDLSFVKVDLVAVGGIFCENVRDLGTKEAKELIEELGDYGFDVGYWFRKGRDEGVWIKEPDGIGLEVWYERQSVVLGTVFDRELSLFMMANPDWFNGYTGERVAESEIKLKSAGATSLGLL